MSLNIPSAWEPQIQVIADAQQISTEKAFDRIIQAGVKRFQTPTTGKPRVAYASLFGSVTGPGAHGSTEAVDRYIAQLRSEW